MIMEIQVLPTPAGTAAGRYAHVDAAIAVIEATGLPYEVGPLGTSVEGTPDELWPLVRAVHEATMTSGAESVVTVVKAAQIRSGGPSMDALVAAHRPASER